MSGDNARRVDLSWTGRARFRATNARGGTIELGTGEDTDFTPVELLLVAIAGCSAADVDLITGKRSDPASFEVVATGNKIRDDLGNRLVDLALDFQVRFPDDEGGQRAEQVLERSVRQSHDRLCTVTRTVEVGSPVSASIRGVQVIPPVPELS
ncbi:MAG: OsmC family protein [Propionibacteriaceae bacterium]